MGTYVCRILQYTNISTIITLAVYNQWNDDVVLVKRIMETVYYWECIASSLFDGNV